MARTPEGTALTQTFRARQLTLTQAVLRDLLALWAAVVRPDDFGTFERFAELAATLVGLRRRDAAGMAAAYYEAFRRAEGVPGAATALLAPPVGDEVTTGTLRGAALAGAVAGRQGGQSHEEASRSAFVRASGSATRLVLGGGRDTLTRSVRADEQALGWIRVTDGDPCAFCRMLASRGPEYKSRATAGFQAHDHDACQPEPFFEGSKVPALNERFEAEYIEAQRWARRTGNAAKGTGNDALNNLRNYLAQRT